MTDATIGNTEPRAFSHENRPLTAIRGVAAVGVFFTHATVAFEPYLPRDLAIPVICGWLGVDLFFVLSGFILASVYGALRPAGWGGFWRKRSLRVFPLNAAVLSAMALLALFGIDPGGTVVWPDLPLHYFMLQSFVPGHRAGWLFNTWSVGVELFCYAGFPVLVLVTARLGRLALTAAVGAAALLCLVTQHRVLGSFWGFDAVARGGVEFLLGAAVGFWVRRLGAVASWMVTGAEVGGLLGMIFAVSGGFGHEWCVAQGSWRMASFPLFCAVLIGALGFDSGPVAKMLRWWPLVWLGQVSFSLYLLHGPVIMRLAVYGWIWGGWPPPVHNVVLWALGTLAVTLVLAQMTYRWIEVPARRLGLPRK